VADDDQRRGIGMRMLEQLAEIAAERGVNRFDAEVMFGNRAMLGSRGAGFAVRPARSPTKPSADTSPKTKPNTPNAGSTTTAASANSHPPRADRHPTPRCRPAAHLKPDQRVGAQLLRVVSTTTTAKPPGKRPNVKSSLKHGFGCRNRGLRRPQPLPLGDSASGRATPAIRCGHPFSAGCSSNGGTYGHSNRTSESPCK
jgi:hypothetical protein